jgi:hypothetical protein
MDLRKTDGDMVIVDGELQFVVGQEAIAQDIEMRLETWLGETVYDVNAGVPYLQVIFAERNPNLNAIRFILEAIVRRTPGVLSVVEDFTTDLDRQTRVLTVTGTAVTIEGNVDFSLIKEVAE